MESAQPNPAHHALAALERRGLVQLLVTQNVDGLHQKSGSSHVVDLHGRLDQVVCLSCARALPRSELQQQLAALNPGWQGAPAASTPDGDADLGDRDTSQFRVVACEGCGGLLKPDVVFFGEHVPAARVERSMAALNEARSLLVIGSSLMVFSGFRFPRAARKLGLPIAVLNRGRTRADEFAAVKVDAEAGAALQHVLEVLTPVAVVSLASSRG
jgi:NAD-dependent SIR2 family protein deacetylase